MKKILALILLAGLVYGQTPAILDNGTEVVIIYPDLSGGGGGGGGSGDVTAVGSLTNNQVIVGAGGSNVKSSGVTAYDPNILIDMIGTNSTAIDDRYGDSVTVVEASSNHQENGTNLINAVKAFTSASTAGTVVLTDGIYDLPETLSISNSVMKITATRCLPVSGYWDGTDIQSTPITEPFVTITGNVSFASSTAILGSVLSGVKVVGNVSAQWSASSDISTPNSLVDCYITGNIASNEQTAMSLNGTFVGGSYATAASGIYNCIIRNSTIIGDDSFHAPSATGADKMLLDNLWSAGSGCFRSNAVRSGAPVFRGGIINGENFMVKGTAAGKMEAYNVLFYNTSASTGTWDGIADDAASKIFGCFGVHTNLINYSTAPIRGSYDWNNVDVSN